MTKLSVAIHKFASCDGCQLAFLNAGDDLLALSKLVNIEHFAEAGPCNPDAVVDIAFVEGSISTGEDLKRIQSIRENSQFVITIGACATAGGVQALRNARTEEQWLKQVYSNPEYIDSLATSTPIAEHIKVDYEIWGCPVNTAEVLSVLTSLLNGITPHKAQEKVCLDCKRQQQVCVMVARNLACMGPITRNGCGALCPKHTRECYACYGPAVHANTDSLVMHFKNLGLQQEDIIRHFKSMNVYSAVFSKAVEELQNNAK